MYSRDPPCRNFRVRGVVSEPPQSDACWKNRDWHISGWGRHSLYESNLRVVPKLDRASPLPKPIVKVKHGELGRAPKSSRRLSPFQPSVILKSLSSFVLGLSAR